MPFPTLPAGHVPTGAELKQITDALAVVGNIGIYTATTIVPTVVVSTTSYVDFTGAAISFSKLQDSSLLYVHIDLSGYLFAGTVGVQELIAAHINGADYQVSQFNFNASTDHRAWGGTAVVSLIPAGSYVIQARAKMSAASHTAQHDTGDVITMTVQEIPQ